MAHLEKMFVSEGLPERPYHTFDSRVTYKHEVATAEVKETKEIKQSSKEFHPITTEIHVTELRPIKLESLQKRGASESHYQQEAKPNQMWERRLQSESGVTELQPAANSYSTMDYQRESHQSHQNHSSSTMTRQSETSHINQPDVRSNMIRTVTSRTGSYSGSSPGSSPSGTLSPTYRREKGTAEFRRRDVSPDFSMQQVSSEQKVSTVDGKCQCCPYGFHVDVDFMNYCDTLSNQSYLKQLKRIQREKRKLRQSMEVYLQDQENTDGQSTLINPMENHSHFRETTTNRLLDEIDSSVDQTLTSIDTMMSQSSQSQRYMDSGTATVQRGEPKKFNTFPKKVGKQVAQQLQSYNETFTATFNDSHRADSNGSLSSVSTNADERVQLLPLNAGYATTETTTTRTSNMTSQQLAETMATLLPAEDGAASPQSNHANISKESLHAIREAMAVSLQRMKDLEEQVKAIPVLQVRISVLKEEKRLLGLQMQAQKHVNTESRGVGDCRVDAPPMSPVSPPPTLPKPRVKMAAVGDHNVHEPYFLQPELEDSVHVFERDTLIIDRAQRQQAVFTPEKPLTRTVGVGEGNVLDDSLHIHEKELRTVIIGQGISAGKRNVGINCRVPTRDVGVAYNFDSVEKPATRSVGITTELTPVTTNVSFRSEEFTSALRSALSKSVRSMAVQVDSRSELCNVAVQSEVSRWNIRSVAVGDCSIDVEVRNPVARRSVSIDAYPDRMNRAMNTDYGWRLDATTNTVSQFTDNIGVQTEQQKQYNAFTMTDRSIMYQAAAQTDVKVFIATDQIKNSGTNTDKKLTYNTGMNTILKPSYDRGINTVQMTDTRNCGMNTEGPSVRTMGVSDDRIDSFVCDLEEEEEYRFEEEGEETKTVYYTSMADQKDTKKDKGYEIKREYASDTNSSKSLTTDSSQKRLSRSSSEESEQNIEILEEKVWRTSGDGQFTVTIVTTKRVYGGKEDGSVNTETKTITGGPEILGSDADRILEECRKGRTSGGNIADSSLAALQASDSSFSSSSSRMMSSSSSAQMSGGSSSGSGSTSTTTFKVNIGEGDTALERVLGKEEYEEYLKKLEQSDKAANEYQSSLIERPKTGRRLNSNELLDGGMSSSSLSSSDRKVTHTTIIRDGSTSPQVTVTEQRFSTGDISPQTDSMTRSFDSGLSTGSASSSTEVISRTISSSSQMSDSGSPSGTLKSIMKKSTSDPGGNQRRGITFADTVVGGETDDEESSDNSEGDDDEEDTEGAEEEEVEESNSRGTTSDSDSSYDEGCYDSRAGSIVYKCKDDEAIANGIPGAKMFDQNIRETFELGQDMKGACETLATYLEDSTKIQTKQLNSSLGVIQSEWFKVSSSKLADAHQNEDYLSCFNEISKRLLEYIVNMQDSNGNTAMHYAVSNCNFEIVNLLLDTGLCDLNKMNKAGYTSVIMATLANLQTQRQEEVVQRLFSMGDVNAKSAKDGQTAMMFAVRQGRDEMVKMLLDTGADLNIQDNEGSTALMCAAEHGHTEIIKMLLNTPGCDASLSDNFCLILSSDILLETSFQGVSNDMLHDRIGQEQIEILQTVKVKPHAFSGKELILPAPSTKKTKKNSVSAPLSPPTTPN